MEAIIPYLYFNGNVAEAPDFYSKAPDGQVVLRQTYGQFPMPSPEANKDKMI